VVFAIYDVKNLCVKIADISTTETMKFTADRATLAAVTSQVGRVVPKSSSIAAGQNLSLSHFLVEAQKEFQQVTISGYNDNVGIQMSLPAQVDAEGTVTAEAETFADVLSDKRIDKVSVSQDKGFVVVKGKGTYKVRSLPPTGFPSFDAPLIASVKLDGFELATAIGFTETTVADDKSGRPQLMGMFLEIIDNEFSMTSSIGHVTNEYVSPIKAQTDDPKVHVKLLLRPPVLKEMRQVLNATLSRDSDPWVTLEIRGKDEPSMVVFRWNVETGGRIMERVYISRILVHEFPRKAIHSWVPKEFNYWVRLDRRQFLDAIVCISRIIPDHSVSSSILTFTRDNLHIEGLNHRTGESGDENMEVQFFGLDEENGEEEFEIVVSPKYLQDSLKLLKSTQLDLCFTGPLKPIFIYPVSNDVRGTEYMGIVMPRSRAKKDSDDD
jgi:DNA polymerase III sliding clamp (beta) subunit (PCNA family)